jgi:hypothetical protein
MVSFQNSCLCWIIRLSATALKYFRRIKTSWQHAFIHRDNLLLPNTVSASFCKWYKIGLHLPQSVGVSIEPSARLKGIRVWEDDRIVVHPVARHGNCCLYPRCTCQIWEGRNAAVEDDKLTPLGMTQPQHSKSSSGKTRGVRFIPPILILFTV